MYAREASGESVAQVAGVQEDAPPRPLLAIHLARHHIPRSELGKTMLLLHEALAAVVHQHRTLAANGLRDQGQRILGRVQRRGMELHELHVAQLHARPVRHGEAVPRGHLRIGGIAIDLAAPARGQHGCVGDYLGGHPGHARPHAAAAVAVHYQVEHARLLHHLDLIRLTHAGNERRRHLGARLVAVRMHYAPARVCGLVAQLQPSGGTEIEVSARCVQFSNAGRALLHQHLHRGSVTQGCSGRQSVPPVQLRRVARSQRRRNPALRVRGGAVEEGALGQQHHLAAFARSPSRV